jgi:hypothetical protein
MEFIITNIETDGHYRSQKPAKRRRVVVQKVDGTKLGMSGAWK